MKKPAINYQKATQNLLKNLPERPKEVIARRYGVLSGKEETLQEIGDDKGITRERVRQIEEWGFNLLKKSPEFEGLDPIFSNLGDYLDFFGGLKKEDVFFYSLAPESQHSALSLILELSPLERFQETGRFYSFWTKGSEPWTSAQKLINFLIKKFEKEKAPIEESDLEKIHKKEATQVLKKKISNEVFASYLEISKEIAKGAFGKIGLFHWSEINPRGVRDEAYLALKKETKPLHFSELTDLINKYFHSEEQTAQVQTVHNELIKDLRFVLVGRGIYALKEWGYEPGVVKDVIAKVLKESKRPLSKEEVSERVLKQRLVRKNTILFNLQDKNYFRKATDGRYQLA